MPVPVRRLVLPAFLAYVVLAVLQTWPLGLHLTTHLTGIPGGDTGVYVWNTWVFRHELVDQHRWPFSTTMVLPLGGPVSLGLHNYTAAANVLALPLQPWLGTVGAFNVVFLLGLALSGLGMFLLAVYVTGRPLPAWIAGALFATSPFLVARGTAHFSLASAGSLPLFVYAFLRTWEAGRRRDAALAGMAMAWASYSDPYYAIYCALLAVMLAACVTLDLTASRRAGTIGRVLIDVLLVVLATAMAVVYGLEGGEVHLGPLAITMHTLYTPMLIAATLVVVRAAMTWRVTVQWRGLPPHVWRMATVMVGTAAFLMGPTLAALANLMADGRFTRAPVLWRSSAPGADLLAFLLPNPNHPWAPAWLAEWFARQPNRFEENVLSISWVAVATIVVALRRAGARVDWRWIIIAVGGAWLALGPFVLVDGHRTFVPTPWTFLRYVPVLGDARMPHRFGILMWLGLAVLFAQALAAIATRWHERQPLVYGALVGALVLELLPVPRPLYAASVPAIFPTIAADPRDVTVLEMPFGVRDGLSSLGNFGPGSLLYQTVHRKRILGGYLSRVDERTKAAYEQHPVAAVLLAYSDERQPSADALARATAAVPAFLREGGLGYVVIDRDRVPAGAQRWLTGTWPVQKVGEDGALDLYAVR